MPVLSTPGYEASNLGRIRSVDRAVYCTGQRGDYVKRYRGKVLTPSPSSDGYLTVAPSRKTRPVHLLVLEAFKGPRPAGQWGLHDNGDYVDNRPSNLYYGTPTQNALDRIRHGTDVRASRTHCPSGHPLVAPNLVAAHRWRECLACNRALSRRRWLRERGVEPDFQVLADQYYESIMEAAA